MNTNGDEVMGKRIGIVLVGGTLVALVLSGQTAPPGVPGESAPVTNVPPGAPVHLKFSFGSASAPGYTRVEAAARYTHLSVESPFGFENIGGGFPTAVGMDTNNPLYSGYLTA